MSTEKIASVADPNWPIPIAAVVVSFLAVIFGLIGTLIARNATRYAAELQAMQRRRDVEISHLRESEAVLIAAGTAIQSYVWYAEGNVASGKPITPEEWQQARHLIEPAVNGAQKLRAIAPTLPSELLREAYEGVAQQIFEVVRDGVDVWHDAVKAQPDPITRAISATADEMGLLLQTYPVGQRDARRN